MSKGYFCAYYSYLEAIELLTDEERGRLFTALLEYASTGEAKSLSGNERFIFPSIRGQIDRDSKAYEQKADRARKNGSCGGRPKKGNSCDAGSEKTENNQVGFKKPKSSKEKDKEKDKDKDMDKDKDNHRLSTMIAPAGARETTTSDDLLEFSVKSFKGSRQVMQSDIQAAVESMGEEMARAVIEQCASSGGVTWSYVKTALAKAKKSGCTSREQYEAWQSTERLRKNGTIVDRATPSGDNFPIGRRNRPLRLKREE